MMWKNVLADNERSPVRVFIIPEIILIRSRKKNMLVLLLSLTIKGIKSHPEYQYFYF